MLYFVLLNHK